MTDLQKRLEADRLRALYLSLKAQAAAKKENAK